ncbi:hypothetical protein VPH35_063712 [Triticum aestivum]|uniref:uncharacterized protein n=1 Tax=Triticum aestivum TaxID=4565 RepID=UPI001D035695|nr:uncharacterized protein LOC123075837 [Triticum aestivum]
MAYKGMANFIISIISTASLYTSRTLDKSHQRVYSRKEGLQQLVHELHTVGGSTKGVRALLLLLLLICFAVGGQCDHPGCYRSSTFPPCNPDKNRCYCCLYNWTCYKSFAECGPACHPPPLFLLCTIIELDSCSGLERWMNKAISC